MIEWSGYLFGRRGRDLVPKFREMTEWKTRRGCAAGLEWRGIQFVMTRPQIIGYDATTDRRVWLLRLDRLQADFAWDDLSGQKFACFCAMDASSIPVDVLSAFCSRLIRLGCAYLCAWGPDCGRVHDIMDEVVVGDNPPATDLGCLMTTWHAQESLDEAVDFFLSCTFPNEEFAPAGCPDGLAIAVGSAEWATQIERQLRASTTAGGPFVR
jgi:hypothetical protein